MSILLTGASGVLGTQLRRHIACWAPSHSDLDIVNYRGRLKGVDLIVHCAAYTDVKKAEEEKQLCYDINVRGTRNLARYKIPMVYISTEYVFDGEKGNYSEEDYPNPINFYALTKLLGEYECRRTRHVIIRTLFKPSPFEHDQACTDQFTCGDYAENIAPRIAYIINNFKKFPSVINVGTSRKSTYDLAKLTKDVKPISVKDIPVRLPRDTSLDLTKWRSLYG